MSTNEYALKSQEDREIDEKIDRDLEAMHEYRRKTWDEADASTKALADALVQLSPNADDLCGHDAIPLAVLLVKIVRGLGLN